jgi:flagellar motility protein MotE (MotC chaperone)
MNERDRKRVEQCRSEADESLKNLQSAHDEMKTMLTGMTEEGSSLSQEIGSAVRGLQFQDRTSQRIAHVVEDLETLQTKLSAKFKDGTNAGNLIETGFSDYTMHEERVVAGIGEAEAGAGDVELF